MSPGTERLAHTRQAIIEDLRRWRQGEPQAPGDSGGHEPGGSPGTYATGRWQGLREAARGWWEQHPAHLAVDLALPLLQAWARRRPLRLLAVAAGAGALVVLARPWRLISVTGLLVAGLRSQHLASLALQALGAGAGRARRPPPAPP